MTSSKRLTPSAYFILARDNIHEKVWDVTKEGYIILDEENLTPNDRINK
jgi:hypothetical protein